MPADTDEPNPLDEIQAVLDSYCNIPNLNLENDRRLERHNPPTNFEQLDLSLFSPQHKPASPKCAVRPTDKSKRSVIQPNLPRLATSPRLRKRRRPPHASNALASFSPRKLLKKPAKIIAKTRISRRENNKSGSSDLPASPLTRSPRLNIENVDGDAATKGKAVTTPASNDDEESNEFIEQMRQLTVKKLEAEKQKREAALKRTIQQIDELTAKRETEVRRVTGIASKNISKAIGSLKRSMPKNGTDTMSNVQKVLDGQEASNPSILSEVQKLDSLMRTAEGKLQSQRIQNLRTSRTKEQRLIDAARTVSSKREKFSKVLSTVEGVLEKTDMPR